MASFIQRKPRKQLLLTLRTFFLVALIAAAFFSLMFAGSGSASDLSTLDNAAWGAKDDTVSVSVWSEQQITEFLTQNPQRAYFSRLFRYGGFRVGMEIGVAAGRFSEHFLLELPVNATWHMVEPFPNKHFVSRLYETDSIIQPQLQQGEEIDKDLGWKRRGIGNQVNKKVSLMKSLDSELLEGIPEKCLDFLYLDGKHSYMVLREELPRYIRKVRVGGVVAGHDYCDHGDAKRESCQGCDDVLQCLTYTEEAARLGKDVSRQPQNQKEVVRAVQEYVVQHLPNTRLHHTKEDFSRESLSADGMNYDLVITSTRNPSFWFVRPPDNMIV